jgi:hypothetical protein
MTKHRKFIALTLFLAVSLGLLLGYGRSQVSARLAAELPPLQDVVRTLQLTDLSLWTEARYTRHPSQADRFTPFQDFPSALEHFPAGSIIAPVLTLHLQP